MRLILHDVRQFKFKQDLLWVGITTLATIIIWIAYSVYAAFSLSNPDPEIGQLLKPINPTLDKTVLTQLQEYYEPPADFTILIRQKDGDSSRVVTLGTNVLNETETTDETLNPAPSSTVSATLP